MSNKNLNQSQNLNKKPIYILGFIVLAIFTYHIIKKTKHENLTNQDISKIEFAKIGYKAPNFKLTDTKGHEISLSDSLEKFVFINFWATWCPTCDEEMASMEELYQTYKDYGFEMLTITRDKDTDLVVPYIKKNKLTFPVLFDPENEIGKLYQTTGVPETFIVNESGIITDKIIGPRDWSDPRVKRRFKRMLEG